MKRTKAKKASGPGGSIFPDPTAALVRAREVAEELARRAGTAIVVGRAGKVIRIRPKPRQKRKRAGHRADTQRLGK
jgi:hypothetical protein